MNGEDGHDSEFRYGARPVPCLHGLDVAERRGVEATPPSADFAGPNASVNGLVLGFAAVRPDAARRGMERLGAAIETARRR